MAFARSILQGVTHYEPSKTYNGYTLFAPFGEYDAWLIDMEGWIVHHWKLAYKPGMFARLLPNGNLLYGGSFPGNRVGPDLGVTFYGVLCEVDWDGDLVWKHEDPHINHDFWRLDNGNTIAVAYEKVPDKIKLKVKGGLPEKGTDYVMWGDKLIEITPDNEVVWEWRAHEHLDPEQDIICPCDKREEWTHMNTSTVLPDGNILISIRNTDTIAIVEKTSGNIIWKWGPGEISHQHEPTLLENGNILLFDNGSHRQALPPYSRVIEVNPKTNKIEWEYKDDPPTEFFSSLMAGCQRLANGNTLITETEWGRIFEVTHEGELVWEYVCPMHGTYLWRSHDNLIYRSYRYGLDYPAFKGKDLSPSKYEWLNGVYGPEVLKRI